MYLKNYDMENFITHVKNSFNMHLLTSNEKNFLVSSDSSVTAPLWQMNTVIKSECHSWIVSLNLEIDFYLFYKRKCRDIFKIFIPYQTTWSLDRLQKSANLKFHIQFIRCLLWHNTVFIIFKMSNKKKSVWSSVYLNCQIK